MCDDRRIAIIRAVMLLLLAAALLPWSFWAFYALTLLVVGLMYPAFATGSCGTVNSACSGSALTTGSFTVSGYVSALCGSGTGPDNCATKLNITYAIPLTNGSASCGGSLVQNFLSCLGGVGRFFTADGSIAYGATHTLVSFDLQCDGGHITTWDSGTTLGASPLDCTSLGTVTLSLTADPCSFNCNAAATSVAAVFT